MRLFGRMRHVFDKELLGLCGMRAVLAGLFVSAAAQAALVVGQTLALAWALAALWEGQPFDSQLPLLAAFFGCFAARRVIVFAEGELLDRYACARASDLKGRLLACAFDGRASLAHENGTAATAASATEGIDDIARYLRAIPPKQCGVIAFSLPLLGALFAIDWVSGVIALVALPVIAAFMVMLGRQARTSAERQFGEGERLSNHFVDMMRGLETLSAFGAEHRAGDSVFAASERLRAATVRTLSVATLSSAILDLITVFGVAGIAMLLAFRLMDGSVNLATALTALMLAPEYFAPIRAFASDFHASLDGRNALAAAMRIIGNGEGDGTTISAGKADSVATCAIVGKNDMVFEAHGIGFSYDETAMALDDVCFSCPSPAIIGIVGASGAGKSTLVDLIAGFKAPTEGGFALGGNALDTQGDSWKRALHYIPQHPYLFRATLADNLRFYSPDARREDVERAAAMVGLGKLIAELPDGLDTFVGEGGRELSGGEAQRVALARTLLDERSVLLLDEPTAHLDIETEYELKERMLARMEGKLVFLATHRVHWLAEMDLAIVLEGGHVAEIGRPSDLLAHPGALRRFVDAESGVSAA